MYRQNNEYHSKWMTIGLVACLFVFIVTAMGVFVGGPYYENAAQQQVIIQKIEENHEQPKSIKRNAFQFVSFTVFDDDEITIYDENGEYLLSRDIDTLQEEKVKEYVEANYPTLIDAPIQVAYGYDSIAYYIEHDLEVLVIDYDSLEELFYMKEGL